MSFTGSFTSLPSCLDGAQQGAKRHSPRTSISTRSPWLPAHFTCFPGFLRSRVLVYHLGILPDNLSIIEVLICRGFPETEKNSGKPDGRTDRRTNGETRTHARTEIMQMLLELTNLLVHLLFDSDSRLREDNNPRRACAGEGYISLHNCCY